MLSHNKLLIDNDCPMCKLYGNCFVKYKLLDSNSLQPYQFISDNNSQSIDMERARTEIALHNKDTGITTYGLDSIIKILSHNHRTLRTILHWPLFYGPLQVLYKFISYNRKVICPNKIDAANTRQCLPATNNAYQWTYIIFVALFTAVVVNAFTYHLFTSLGWEHRFTTELCTCFGQIIWQGIAASLLVRKNRMTYLGNMSSVSFIGAIILLPLLIVAKVASLSIPVLLGYFTLVIGIMFLEHLRRCHVLGITKLMTVSWVSFRVFALSLILLSLGVINF